MSTRKNPNRKNTAGNVVKRCPTVNYHFAYPVRVFSEKSVLSQGTAHFFSSLIKKNPYYRLFNRIERAQFRSRYLVLQSLIPFIRTVIKPTIGKRKIISIYVYGSYIFGNALYQPGDIDIGVVVSGCFFKYDLLGKKIPNRYNNRFPTRVNQINLFIYGQDNMEKGLTIDDTVRSSFIHRDTTKRELSVGYWRNVILYGREFELIRNNKKNAYMTMLQNLRRTEIRIQRCSRLDSQLLSDNLQKIASRLYEALVFSTLFDSSIRINIQNISAIPAQAQKNLWGINDANSLFLRTKRLYVKIGHKLIK